MTDRGFLYPLLGIAEELRAAGVHSSFVTGAQVQSLIQDRGFEGCSHGFPDAFDVSTWAKPLQVLDQFVATVRAVEEYRPDVLLTTQLAFGPLMAAELTTVPVLVLGFATYLWPRTASSEVLISDTQARRAQLRFSEMLKIWNHVRALVGMPSATSDPCETELLGDRTLLQSVPSLEGPIESLPARVSLVGSCVWDPGEQDGELEAWLSSPDDRPIIYLQHGRSFELPTFLSPVLVAASKCAVRVAGSLGREKELIPRRMVTPQLFLRPHIPQRLVMERAAAVISTGNSTAVLGALEVGLPLLLIPGGNESCDLAERCESAGVAIVVPIRDVSAEVLASSLRRLLTERAYRRNALKVRDEIVERAGPRTAAAMVTAMAKC